MSIISDPVFRKNVAVEYALTLPSLIMPLQQANTEKELNNLYSSSVYALKRPWKKKVRTDRIRTNFWTAELNNMAKTSKILHDRGRKSQSTNDIRAHKNLKGTDEENGCRSKKGFIRYVLRRTRPTTALNRDPENSKNVESISAQGKGNEKSGPPMSPTVHFAHVASVCSAEIPTFSPHRGPSSMTLKLRSELVQTKRLLPRRRKN